MRYLIIILFLCNVFPIHAQGHFEFIKDEDKAVIPFQFVRNLALVPIKINGVDLIFLVDTGVKETILFSLEDNTLSFKNTKKLKFNGLGENEGIEAIQATGNTVEVGGELIDTAHTVYVILNSDFNFSAYVGVPINGILGSHFFKDHPVEVDFVKHKLTVYRDSEQIERKVRKYERLDIELENSRPYIDTWLSLQQEGIKAKMLVDMGNSDAIMVFPSRVPGFRLNEPNIEEFIGRGFSGDIHGRMSRIHQFQMGKFNFRAPTSSFPDSIAVRSAKLVKDRVGSVGNELLMRFNIIFDYTSQAIYIRKNKFYNKPFLVDMSGLDVKHDGMIWVQDWVKVNIPSEVTNDQLTSTKPVYEASTGALQYKFVLKPSYSVVSVRKGSPAEHAGLKKGDMLISINRRMTGMMSLDQIQHSLSEDEGKKINMVIRRNDQDVKVSFRLKDPIPYVEPS
ncbi:PDZ domain-containing protein [Sphingobacterium spiritivorum]|uniref:PDZ domain-containing protein n=1 Tax=Sphingobacterium spiritivorum TaxID=258 RepID=UPI003DA53ABA